MRAALHRLVEQLISTGDIKIQYADGTSHRYGDGSGPPFEIIFHDKARERAILTDPTLAFGEGYMDGDIEIRQGTLYDALDLLYTQARRIGMATPLAKIGEGIRFAKRRLDQWNTISRSRENVAHHYDISNARYETFLDEDLQYSCAYFEDEGQSLDAAQLAKKRHIAAKLCLRPGDRVLDIGCGWGGMGLYLAKVAEADVTGITLSDEQLALANQRAEADGVKDRARFIAQDYRLMSDEVDRIVSVGMFEHVGLNNFDTYFQQCRELLKDDGVMLVHSIGRSDGPGITNPFISKYIFPGGYIPALSEVLPAIEKAGLVVTDIEILRLHYAETLRAWRERFFAAPHTVPPADDPRFCRMWEFYLVISELAFRRIGMMVFQIQATPDQSAVPLTRDYIAEAEARLKRAERRDYGHLHEDHPGRAYAAE